VLTVGHQERFVLSQSGLLDVAAKPVLVECLREGPWTGRGTDVSVVLDLMIHDLDLAHSLVRGTVAEVRAEGHTVYGYSHDAVSAELLFDMGTVVRLSANRAADQRKRSLHIVYGDGSEVAVDFLTREFVNTTHSALDLIDSSDPLRDSIAAFVSSVRAGEPVMVQPEEALRALETALLIEEALVPAELARIREALRRTA
jgi:predicted dehydrogenase